MYKWFLLIYKISYVVGVFGYFTMLATFMGFNFIFNAKPATWMDTGLMCMFYALYYGVMARDFAEICTEKMAANIGNDFRTFSSSESRAVEPEPKGSGSWVFQGARAGVGAAI